jgi:hypothetical protein
MPEMTANHAVTLQQCAPCRGETKLSMARDQTALLIN